MGNVIGLLLGFLIKPASFPFLVKYTAYIPKGEQKYSVGIIGPSQLPS